MKHINAIRLASFIGNIGDNANHSGADWVLHNELNNVIRVIKNIEIRDFYWRKREFDINFVNEVNKYDLLIIGGGNYFELWPEKSATSTSIDIKIELLDKLSTPILIYSLGCDDGLGIADKNKFRMFIDKLLEKKSFISFRNDGSMKTFLDVLGDRYKNDIHLLPDNGFFISRIIDTQIKKKKNEIAVNLAGDMLDQRFNDDNFKYEDFLKDFSFVINALIEDGYSITLIPHIYKDIYIIADLMKLINDSHIRRSVNIAPYIQGNEGMFKILEYYQKSRIVIGMRFHANVCPMSLNIPTIGLSCYPQIDKLYDDLMISSNCIKVNKGCFHNNLMSKIQEIETDYNSYCIKLTNINKTVYIQAHETIKKISSWLETCASGRNYE